MSAKQSIGWFKATFAREIATAVASTPFCENILAAIAYQETGYLWGPLVKTTPVKKILEVCVGDTIDSPGRSAFPKNKAELLTHPQGQVMFQIARQALVDVAETTGQYGRAVQNPNKFCRGFGIFQYDLQFFKSVGTDYFLNKEWHSFEKCLERCVGELKTKLKKVFPGGKTSLTDLEKAHVAIAYNRGSFDPAKKLKQGHKNSNGEYYGELVYSYYLTAKSVVVTPAAKPEDPVAVVVEGDRPEPVAPLPGSQAPPTYPGHLIRKDSADKESVKLLQKRLKALGYTGKDAKGKEVPLEVDGEFGTNTENAVELFQFRHTDSHGRALVADGVVGPATWAALFGLATVGEAPVPAAGTLLGKVVAIAGKEVGVLEVPPGSNKGPRVEEYLRSTGLGGGYFWCAAFVFWCYREAAKELGITNPAIKTAGVLDMWNRARTAGYVTVTGTDAAANPALVTPGMIFTYATGGGYGHTGIVTAVSGLQIETIEGNTDTGGSRNGIGVFRRKRSITSINRGFIDYGRKGG